SRRRLRARGIASLPGSPLPNDQVARLAHAPPDLHHCRRVELPRVRPLVTFRLALRLKIAPFVRRQEEDLRMLGVFVTLERIRSVAAGYQLRPHRVDLCMERDGIASL